MRRKGATQSNYKIPGTRMSDSRFIMTASYSTHEKIKNERCYNHPLSTNKRRRLKSSSLRSPCKMQSISSSKVYIFSTLLLISFSTFVSSFHSLLTPVATKSKLKSIPRYEPQIMKPYHHICNSRHIVLHFVSKSNNKFQYFRTFMQNSIYDDDDEDEDYEYEETPVASPEGDTKDDFNYKNILDVDIDDEDDIINSGKAIGIDDFEEDESEDDDDEQYDYYGKFHLETGQQSDDDDKDTTNFEPKIGKKGVLNKTPEIQQQSESAVSLLNAYETKLQIQQQQEQINMLMDLIRQQQQQPQQQSDQQQGRKQAKNFTAKTNNFNRQSSTSSSYLPPPLPGIFKDEQENLSNEQGEDELLDHDSSSNDLRSRSFGTTLPKSNNASTAISAIPSSSYSVPYDSNTSFMPLAPLKAMLFIDGTWLYYSLHRRKENDDPIVQKFGRGWQYRYRFDWSSLPRIVCEQLAKQQVTMGWSSTSSGRNVVSSPRPIEMVRASVFTSYKKSTDPNSFRVQMYNDMADSNYDVHMIESFGNGPEKCVDISLAVEMLHYATVPNAYDVAILLSGDKDFIPAMVRTRQKGRKVGIVSMRTGCNRALYESPHVKDFDVVWIDDFLDQLLVPLPPEQVGKLVESIYDRGLLSAFTMTKVILDFVSQSPTGKVSSRDVGRYLKALQIKDGTNLLDDLKVGQGGLRRFLQDRMPNIFKVTDKSTFEIQTRDPRDKSYWIEKKEEDVTAILLQEAKKTVFSEDEKKFLADYQAGKFRKYRNEDAYYHSINLPSNQNFHTPREMQFTNDLVKSGDSSNPTLDTPEDYSKFTLVLLKEKCKERSLPVSGTKAVLIERLETYDKEHYSTSMNESSFAHSHDNILSSNDDWGREVDSIDKDVVNHIENIIKYYISQNGGEVSSRNLGRFLNVNKSCKDDGKSALQDLKDNFGNLAAFLNSRNDIFSRSNEPNNSSEFSFNVSLKESTPSLSRPRSVDSNISSYLESLIKEYLTASGGIASSRNVGRYLAANSAQGNGAVRPWERNKRTALQQLKDNYGSLAGFLNAKEEKFLVIENFHDSNTDDPPSEYNYGIRLR